MFMAGLVAERGFSGTVVDLGDGFGDLAVIGDVADVVAHLGHEAQHDLDTIARQHLAGAAGLSAVDEVRKSETNAYSTQALIYQRLGLLLTKEHQREGVESSVEKFTNRQTKPVESKPTEAK